MKDWIYTTVPIVTLDGNIICPTCNGSMLHHVEVKSWFRREDEDSMFVHAMGDVVLVNRGNHGSNYGNPSPRRSGIKIAFRCEWCHTNGLRPSHELVIYQHKGKTFTEIRCSIEDKS